MPRPSRLTLLISTLCAISLPAIAIASMSASRLIQPSSATRADFETAEASVGTISRVVATSGPVRPWVTVQIGSQLSGQIRRVHADFNSEVKEGDILAELDAKMFESRVEQAEADLVMAKAALANQQATLLKAEAVLLQAEQARGRQHALSQKGVTSQANVDATIRDTRVAQAEIAVTRAQILNAEANVRQREAMLNQARIELDRTRIRSPINGTVVSRTVDIGQTVAASLQAPELFRIAQDLRSIHIEAQVNEADIGTISKGNSATFTIDTYPGRVFEGKVAQVRLAPNEVQSVVTYAVLIEAKNADLKLFPGMTANVRIETARHEEVLRIPAEALRYKPAGKSADADPATSRADRNERQIERLKELLKLSDDQVKLVAAALEKKSSRMDKGSDDGSADADSAKPSSKGSTKSAGRSADRIEAALGPVLTSEQRAAFEVWKAKRDTTRPATVWVIGEDGQPQARSLRVGISDARFAEVVGGALKPGETLIIKNKKVVAR